MKPKYIILHTAAFKGDADIDEVRRWHVLRGFNGIGYHYYIRRSGKLQVGRAETTPGAHAIDLGMNSKSIGICFEGHGDHEPLTQEQRNTLCDLYINIVGRWDIPTERVWGHRETGANKTCPGTQFDMKDIRNMLELWRSVQHLPERQGDEIEPVFPDVEPPDNAFEGVDLMGGSSWRLEGDFDKLDYKPKKKDKTMLQRVIKIGRDTFAGLLGGGAGFALSGSIEAAVLIGVCALLVALGVDFDVVQKFRNLFSSHEK